MSLESLNKFKRPTSDTSSPVPDNGTYSALESFKKGAVPKVAPVENPKLTAIKQKNALQDTVRKEQETIQKNKDTIYSRNETISAPTGNETIKPFQKFKDFLDRITTPQYARSGTAQDIKISGEAQIKNRQEQIKELYGNEPIIKTFAQGFQSGVLGLASTAESATGVALDKLGFYKAGENLKKKAHEDIALGQEYTKAYQPELLDQRFSTKEKLKNPQYVMGLIGNALPNIIATTIPAIATGGAGAALGASAGTVATTGAITSTIAGSGLTFGDAYNSAKSYGLNDRQSENIAFATALTTAPLEFIPEFRLFSKFAGKETTDIVKKEFVDNLTDQIIKHGSSFTKQGGLETMTEIPQTVIENAWKKTYDENQDLFEGVPEAGVTAFFTGGLTDVLFTSANALLNKVKPEVVDQELSFFKKTGNKEIDAQKNEIKTAITESIKDNGIQETVDLISHKNNVDKEVALRIVQEAVAGTKLESEVEKAQQYIAKEKEREQVVFEPVQPQLPDEVISVIPENQKEYAGTVWQETMELDYADKLQQISELQTLLENSQDENEQKDIAKEISDLESEVNKMVTGFIKNFEQPQTKQEVSDREQKLMGTIEQMTESGVINREWNDTYAPVLNDKLKFIDEQNNAELQYITDKIAQLEAIDSKTPAQRLELQDLQSDLSELNADIKQQKDAITRKVEDSFIEKMRVNASKELYYMNQEGTLPYVIPMISPENAVSRAIMPLILNGENIADIKAKQLVQFTDDIEFETNGILNGEPVGEDNVLITRFDGQPIEEVMSLQSLYDNALKYIDTAKVKPKQDTTVFSTEKVRKLEKQLRDAYKKINKVESATNEQDTVETAVQNAVDSYRGNMEFDGIYMSDEDFNNLPQLDTIRENARQEYLTRENNKSSIVDEQIGVIRAEFELAQAGKRAQGPDGQWYGISSTFPQWLDSEVRNKTMMTKMLGYVASPSTFSYPSNPMASLQRLLVNNIFDRLDERTGVDTSSIRNQIIQEYEKQRTKQTNNGNSDSSSEGTFAERFEGISNFAETNTTTEQVTSQDIRYHGAWLNTQSIVSQPITTGKALSIFRDFIPESTVSVQFMKNITTPDGGRAFGASFRNVVQFVENPQETTVYHETVHAFLTLFTDQKQRDAYNRQAYKNAVKEKGIVKVEKAIRDILSMYQYKISDDKARMIYGEELLADGFISYVKDNETKSPLQRFYDAVLGFIRRIIDSKSADRLYKDIMEQKRDAHNALLQRQDKHFEAINKRYSETTKLISIFESEFTGPTIKSISIEQALNRDGIKQADKDLVLRTVKELGALEVINRADFIQALRENLFNVTVHVNNSYADYGLDNLRSFNGSDSNSVKKEVVAETHIYDTPFKHGETGHFRSFYNDIADASNLVIRHVVGEQNGETIDTYAVVDTTIQMTEDTIHRAVIATFDNNDQAEQFISDIRGKKELQSGLLGHTRVGYLQNNTMKINMLKKSISEEKDVINHWEQQLIERKLEVKKSIDVFKKIEKEVLRQYNIAYKDSEYKVSQINQYTILEGANTVAGLYEKEADKKGYVAYDTVFRPSLTVSRENTTDDFKIVDAKQVITAYYTNQAIGRITEAKHNIDLYNKEINKLKADSELENNTLVKYIFEIQADPLQSGNFKLTPTTQKLQNALEFTQDIEKLKSLPQINNAEIIRESNGVFSSFASKGPITIVFKNIDKDTSVITFDMGNFRSIDYKPYNERTDDEKARIDKWLSDSKENITKLLEEVKKEVTSEEKDFFAIGKDFHNFAIKKEVQSTALDLIENDKTSGLIRVPTALTLSITENHVKGINTFKASDQGFTKNKAVSNNDNAYDITEIPWTDEVESGDIVSIGGVPYMADEIDGDNGIITVVKPDNDAQPYEGTVDNTSIGDTVTLNDEDYVIAEVSGDDAVLIRKSDLQTGTMSDYVDGMVSERVREIKNDFNKIQEKYEIKVKTYADFKQLVENTTAMDYVESDTRVFLEGIIEDNDDALSDDDSFDLDDSFDAFIQRESEFYYNNFNNAEDFGFTEIYFDDIGNETYYYGTANADALYHTYTSDSGQFTDEPVVEYTREELGLPPVGKQIEPTEQTTFDKNGEYVFNPSELYSDDARTVHNYYKNTVIPAFRKLRKDARLITDERGLQWWESTVTPADSGEVVMFMPDKTGLQQANELSELSLSDLKPIELPELIELSKELLGKLPELTGKFKTKLGAFYSREGQPAVGIKLDRNLTPQMMTKVLAHELGHLVDFLPDNTMKKGNLLGRLAQLDSFFKEKFDSIIPRNKELRDELKTLTTVWTPFNPLTAPRDYVQYRYSAKELYAEFISMLLNNPSQAQSIAPKFFELFFDNLDKKPEVKQAYFELQDLLNKDREVLLGKNMSAIHDMFLTGEQKALDIEYNRQKIAKQKFDRFGYKLKFELVSTIEPFRVLVDDLKKQGITVPESENPVYGLEERNYMGGRIQAFMSQNIDPIYTQLHTIGLSWETFGTKLFLDRIASGDRSKIANPDGITQERAKELLAKMENDLGNDYQKIEVLADDFRKSMKSLLKESFEIGLITEEQYLELNKNDKYSTFQTLDHIDEKITAKIHGQVGTFKPIRNVATASVMKMLATIRRNEYQKARIEAVNFLQKYHPEDIQEADQGFDGEGKFFKEPNDSTKSLIEVRMDGKRKGYYIDSYIAKSINNQKIENVKATLTALQWTNSKIFRPAYVVLSPGFHLFNLIKDFGRFALNIENKVLPVALWNTAKLYAKSIRASAIKSGLKTNFTEADDEALGVLAYLYKNKVLSVGFNEYILQKPMKEGDQIFDEKEIEYILRNHGIMKPDGDQKTELKDIPKKVLNGLLNGISTVGEFIESLPKVAGYYQFVDQQGELTRENKSFIRRKLGSPDFLDGGYLKPITNEVFLFSNAIIQGIKADVDVATDPHTRSAWWWKNTQLTIVPHILMLGAMLGLFGDEIEKIMDGVSEYDKTNFIIIPIGLDENGKSIYWRMPQPEMTRLVGSVAWKTMITASGENRNTSKAIGDVFSFFAGQFPGVAPAIKTTNTFVDMLSGRNPYDSFYGKNIISDQAFTAGGKYRWNEYAGWVFDQITGGLFGRVYNQNTERKSTTLEKTLRLPIVSNVAGRFLKVSDQGTRAKFAEEKRIGERDTARASIKRNELVQEYVKDVMNKPALSDAELQGAIVSMISEEFGYNPISDSYKGTKNAQVKTDREEAFKMRDKFEAMYIRGGGVQNAFISSLDSAANNTSKRNIINIRKEDMPLQDFLNEIQYAYEIGAISKPIYDEYTNN